LNRFAEAKKAARQGPVFITDHGRPAYVLLNIAHYRPANSTALTAPRQGIATLLAMPDMGYFELRSRPAAIRPKQRSWTDVRLRDVLAWAPDR
jgi:prevent-host-death family protein